MVKFIKRMFIILLIVMINMGVPKSTEAQNLIKTTQGTSYYISKTSFNKVFISTLDGLNVFDGINVHEYSPSSHHMFGNNIQSYFFEDWKKDVWFCTYEALHKHIYKKDDFEYYFMINEDGDTLKSDYKVFQRWGDTLFVSAGNSVYLYDIRKEKQIRQVDANLFESPNQIVIKDDSRIYIIASYSNSIKIYTLTKKFELINEKTINIDAFSLSYYDNKSFLTGTNSGNLLKINIKNGEIVLNLKITNKVIKGITKLKNDLFLLTISEIKLPIVDLQKKKVINYHTIKDQNTNIYYNQFTFPSLDKDSILWMGIDGIGVINKNLKKDRFKHILNSTEYGTPIRVTSINQNAINNLIAISTRGNGLFIVNSGGEVIHHFKTIEYCFNVHWVNKNDILYSDGNNIHIFSIKNHKNKVIASTPFNAPIHSLEHIAKNRFLISTRTSTIYELNILGISTQLKPYIRIENKQTPILGIKSDQNQNLFISENENVISVYSSINGTPHLITKLLISGGLLCLKELDFDTNHWYLSNTKGLYKINNKTFNVVKLIDKKNQLNQTIYSIFEDKNKNLWLSSNKGILKYNPTNLNAISYKVSDGLQGLEFNSNAHMQDKNGHIWMGGVNGVNIFNANKIEPFLTPSSVCIDAVLLNDIPTNLFGTPQCVKQITVNYKVPFSILFHAVDFSDPMESKLKYRLYNSDNTFVELNESKGIIRYTNLNPGPYQLQILSSNSEGIWNTTPHTIEIKIIPPFWMTWWFYSITTFLILIVFYSIIMIYYKRKLERQNQLLREQALIIEKQTAVEKERNRISAEMHDDLGSGLTRIRFLSDKALRFSTDNEERDEIKKIASHSNELVRSMGEIIWAMNSRFDNADSLISYIRRFASEYLEENGIALEFESPENEDNVSLSGEKRRNIFLVLKEILHNAVKYSGAPKIRIQINSTPNFTIHVKEIGGRGFDPLTSSSTGNGIFNMQKRMFNVGGTIEFAETASGMETRVSV